jgi:hypothetical protein
MYHWLVMITVLSFHPQDSYYALQPEGQRRDLGKHQYFLGELQPAFNEKKAYRAFL